MSPADHLLCLRSFLIRLLNPFKVFNEKGSHLIPDVDLSSKQCKQNQSYYLIWSTVDRYKGLMGKSEVLLFFGALWGGFRVISDHFLWNSPRIFEARK